MSDMVPSVPMPPRHAEFSFGAAWNIVLQCILEGRGGGITLQMAAGERSFEFCMCDCGVSPRTCFVARAYYVQFDCAHLRHRLMAHHNICCINVVRKVASETVEPCFAVASYCLDTGKRQGG